jgi:3-hydroxybutyryl-CoA dehydrogenase
MDSSMKVAVAGSGAMGSGIAQVAAMNGHPVVLFDAFPDAIGKAKANLSKTLSSLEEKGKIKSSSAVLERIHFTQNINDIDGSGLVIEAIVENLKLKQELFSTIEQRLNGTGIFATNTSSLSVTLIASALNNPSRMIGVHFFNPAPVMPLVEIIPAIQTDPAKITEVRALVDSWGKTTVLAKDTPGFIVNRVARPFYGEAIRIYEEGIADFATIDWAMKEIGGFRMGPFELMDFIGNDINYTVTETVFREFFYDQRYKPSFTQKRQVEANRLGKKTGIGYYNYAEGSSRPEPLKDTDLAQTIFIRVLVMLINEAVDARFLNIASRDDLDLAMTKGVNYPKGLLRWADELGIDYVLKKLEDLYIEYGEDRYRPSPLLRRMAREGKKFWS